MATETAVPDHVTSEHVQEKENVELKANETEIVSSPKVEELAAPTAPAIESEEKTEDKKIDPPAIIEADKYMDAEKVNDGPGWDVPSEGSDAAVKGTNSDVFSVREPAIKDVKKETLTHTDIAVVPEAVVESIEKPIDSLPTTEPPPEVETKLEEVSEESTEVVKPESVVEEKEAGNPAEELAAPKTPSVESEEKTEDKKIDQPAVIEADKYMDAEKVNDGPGWDVPSEGSDATTKDTKTDIFSASEPTIKDVDKEAVTQPDIAVVPEAVVESVEKAVDSPPTSEPAPEVETPQEEVSEESKEVVKPDSVVEEVSEESKELVKPESVVEEQEAGKEAEIPPELKGVETATPDAEETETDKPVEISASESKVVELPESVVEMEKPGEQSKDTDEVEKESDVKLEQKDSIDPALSEKEGVLINEVEEVTESLQEKEGENQVSVACESLERAASDPPSDVSDKAQGKESEADVLEESTKKASPVLIKPEDENVKNDEITDPETTTNEKVDDVEQSTEVTKKILEEPQESREVLNSEVPEESTKTEGEGDLSSAVGTAEKSLEGEIVSKDLGVVTEEKKEEDVKDLTSTSVETGKDTDLEGKVGDVKTDDTASETVSKPNEVDLEPKATADTVVDELAKAADVAEEIPKSDAPNLESSKGADESKTNEDLPKEEVPKKHSHGIMSKVKQSIVKVKKAITGKSPNSKTISSDAKDDIK